MTTHSKYASGNPRATTLVILLFSVGLFGGAQAASRHEPVSGRPNSAGLVVSGDTDQSVAELQQNIVQGEQIIIPNNRMIQDLDPVYIHARLLALLKSRYPSIGLQSSIARSIAAGNAITVVAGVRTNLGSGSGSTTSVTITLDERDAKGRRIRTISETGSAVIPYPAWDYRIQEATDQALQQVASKL